MLEENARTLRSRAEWIEREIRDRLDGLLRRLQTTIDDLIALGSEWRSLVTDISDQADDFDFRHGRAVALPVARRSLALFEEIEGRVRDARTTDVGCEFQRLADLRLAGHEMANIVRWVESWPEHDPTAAWERSLADVREGRTVSAAEAIGLLGAPE